MRAVPFVVVGMHAALPARTRTAGLPRMSQRTVEQIVGRLATDETFRLRFQANRAAVLDELVAKGLELGTVERRALLELDFAACERFADALDPRIQKVCLRRQAYLESLDSAPPVPPPGDDRP
jgi:hypothetical protein